MFADEVENTFNELKEDAPDGLIIFLDYFENTFIRGKVIRIYRNGKVVYGNAKYCIDQWNIFSRFDEELEHATNFAEVFNNRLQVCNIYGDHPEINKLAILLIDTNQ